LKWKEALQCDFEKLIKQNTFKKGVKLKFGQKAIPMTVVFTEKKDGTRKARMVARGDLQGHMSKELVFSATVQFETVKLVLLVALRKKWLISTLDYTSAFVNAPLDTEKDPTFIKIPKILTDWGIFREECQTFLLKKALYGLKQSPQTWSRYRDKKFEALKIKNKTGREMRFVKNPIDSNCWKLVDDKMNLLWLMTVFVDDVLLAGFHSAIKLCLVELRELFDSSPPKILDTTSEKAQEIDSIGIQMKFDLNMITLTQQNYITHICQIFSVNKPRHDLPDNANYLNSEDCTEKEIQENQRIFGSLIWLLKTRPDIQFCASICASHVKKKGVIRTG